jgi:hypothetical protein
VGLTRLSLLTSSTWFPVAMKPFKRVVDTKPPCFWHDWARCLSMRPSYLQSTRLPDATILHVFGSICIHSKMRNKCVDDTKPPCFWHDW